jgi:hypothetical protein
MNQRCSAAGSITLAQNPFRYLHGLPEHEVRQQGDGLPPVEGELHEPPRAARIQRHEQVGRARDPAAGALEERPVVLGRLEQVGVGYHHGADPAGSRRARQGVGHEPAVAGAGHGYARARREARERVEERGERGGLRRLGGRRRGAAGGAAEAEEVRDDDVEAAGQRANLPAPLPGGHGPEAVDEQQRREARLPRGRPVVDGAPPLPAIAAIVVRESDGVGLEAGAEERAARDEVHQREDAEAHGGGSIGDGRVASRLP